MSMNIKSMIQSALPGWNGRLAAHHICYLANGQVHRGVPYTATDPKIIAKKLELMQSCGIDVVIGTWQGPLAVSCNIDANLMSAACASVGMQFCLLLDPWCAKLGGGTPTQNVTNALMAKSTQVMLEATSYVPEKYVLDFTTGANLAQLAVAFPELNSLAQGTGFSWIAIPQITDSTLRNAAAVANLKQQNATPGMKVPGLCFQFNDAGQPLPVGVSTQAAFDAAGGNRDYSSSVWGGPARILESFGGDFLQQQIAVTPVTAPMIAIVTWDDFDEGTAVEPWIAAAAGVNWSLL